MVALCHFLPMNMPQDEYTRHAALKGLMSNMYDSVGKFSLQSINISFECKNN